MNDFYWSIEKIDEELALVIRCLPGNMLHRAVEKVLSETRNTVVYNRPVYFIFNDRQVKITRDSTIRSIAQDFEI